MMKGANYVYTDTWVDMEFFLDPKFQKEKERRIVTFMPYQINKKLLENGFDYYEPTRRLSLVLSGYMLYLAAKVKTPEQGIEYAQSLLDTGKALDCFLDFLHYQGPSTIDSLKISKKVFTLLAQQDGFVSQMNTERIGLACIELHAGRKTASDTINHETGIEMRCHLGMKIKKDQPLLNLYFENEIELQNALELLTDAILISTPKKNEDLPLVAKVLV